MRLRNTRRLTIFGITVAAMGLLLWARLILVTGRPRTAIADPKDAPPAKPAQVQPREPDAPTESESNVPKKKRRK